VREIGRHSAQVKALRRQIRRRPEGRVIVDGARLVGDLVRWQVPIHDLYLNRTVAADEASEALIAPARRAFVLDDEVFASVAPTRSPQGRAGRGRGTALAAVDGGAGMRRMAGRAPGSR
jgi:tRNA G18 (ribose-2'-O)-methylase SpoU